MTGYKKIWIVALVASCASILPGGCATTPNSRFYTISPVAKAAPAVVAEPSAGALVLGIGPVTIPDYLDRPQIVVRSARNELVLSEFSRWAGSLQNDTARVLRENLEAMLAGDGISVTSWRRGIPNAYRVAVDISRFESADYGVVTLKAQWVIFGGEGSKMLMVRDSSIREEFFGGGIESVVTAMGKALEALGLEIAQGVRDVRSRVTGNGAEKPEQG